MLTCAQSCVFSVKEGGYVGCNDYACVRSHYTHALQTMEACITNSSPGDASDLATASMILSNYCHLGSTITAASTASITRLYGITSAVGYNGMLAFAQDCVWSVGRYAYVRCDSYACVCKNYDVAAKQLAGCVTNSCSRDASDMTTASSIFSLYCAPGIAAIAQSTAATSPSEFNGRSNNNSTLSTNHPRAPSTGAIVGIAIGGAFSVILIVVTIICLCGPCRFKKYQIPLLKNLGRRSQWRRPTDHELMTARTRPPN